VTIAGEFTQILQIEFVRTAVEAGEMHRDPQPQLVGKFQLFAWQKLVDPALRDIACDGKNPVWLEPNEAEFAHVALNVLHPARRCYQSIHARLRILPDLF